MERIGGKGQARKCNGSQVDPCGRKGCLPGRKREGTESSAWGDHRATRSEGEESAME